VDEKDALLPNTASSPKLEKVGWVEYIWRTIPSSVGKVALKILPAELASNQDRMRRFVQQAKAAAALNHPNIATVYEPNMTVPVRR
jgi:serine/threonine protein kinase